eukprot:6210067-Pleurochrysis_carterae.AAC.1
MAAEMRVVRDCIRRGERLISHQPTQQVRPHQVLQPAHASKNPPLSAPRARWLHADKYAGT